ncbi:MAG: Hsp33 family molecular chaperone HslO [Acidobacteria bacterium]|nr:MAG: Hsp33 family molecular chaperone HslO [Acidobacteriota bacterium]
MDKLIHATADGGTVRVLAAITTDVVAEAVCRHQMSPTASAALGRVLTGTLLMASTLKDFDRLSIKIDSNGPIGGIIAEATRDGTVRGYVKNPDADGEGTFYVIRESGFDIGLHRDPYVGSVPIVSGEVAEDLAYYLAKSEQIPSAVLLGVLLRNSEPYVKAAGGVLVQMMPGANEHIITMIEDTIAHAPHLTTVITEGATPKDLAKLALGEMDFEVLEESDVAFKCNCSMERARTLIAALGPAEVGSMLEEDNGAVMSCGFCSEVYQLDEDDLKKILTTEG